MTASQKGKEKPKSTTSKQRKPNQINNSVQKAVELEAHASLFNHAPVIPCKKCEQAINKGLSVKCSLCEAQFCRSCTKIDKVIFDAICANQGISWFCESCQTVPGVWKLLVRIGNIEARQESSEN